MQKMFLVKKYEVMSKSGTQTLRQFFLCTAVVKTNTYSIFCCTKFTNEMFLFSRNKTLELH